MVLRHIRELFTPVTVKKIDQYNSWSWEHWEHFHLPQKGWRGAVPCHFTCKVAWDCAASLLLREMAVLAVFSRHSHGVAYISQILLETGLKISIFEYIIESKISYWGKKLPDSAQSHATLCVKWHGTVLHHPFWHGGACGVLKTLNL